MDNRSKYNRDQQVADPGQLFIALFDKKESKVNGFVQKPIRLIIILLIFATACTYSIRDGNLAYPGPNPSSPIGTQAEQPQVSQTQKLVAEIIPPEDAPRPNTGKASISGTLYSFTLFRVIPKTLLYLTMASGVDNRDLPPVFIGPEQNQGDIAVTSDEKGQFFVNNIPSGNYFLVVSASFRWSLAVISDKDFTPLLIELKPDQRQPLGIVYVSWP